MANTSTTPAKVGQGKPLASVLGGALSLIVIYAITAASGTDIPTDVAQAVQLVVTSLLVYLVPHSFGSGS